MGTAAMGRAGNFIDKLFGARDLAAFCLGAKVDCAPHSLA
jgi:hypothetical protein